MKRTICLLLAAALILGLAGCGMVSDRVIAVEQAIDAIGEVTLESGEKITAARKAFDKLSEKEKKDVSNARKLVAAEEVLKELQGNVSVTELKNEIDNIRDITPASEEKLIRLQEIYDAMPENTRIRVSNYGRLEDAWKVLAVSETIAGLGELIPALKELPGEAASAEALASAEEQIAGAQAEYDTLDSTLQRMLGNADVLEDAVGAYRGALYRMAEKYFAEWDMASALEWYHRLPEDYKETADRIRSAEEFLAWKAAKADLIGTWTWDGEPAAGSDGKTYSADFPTLTISETVPGEDFAGISFREKRLLYVEIKPGTPKKAVMKQTLLNTLKDLRPQSFTAANIENFVHLNDFLEGGRRNYSEDIRTETGPWDDSTIVLYSGINTHGTSGGRQWEHLMGMTLYLQKDGRLRVEYYVRDLDRIIDPGAVPAQSETLVFFYDKK